MRIIDWSSDVCSSDLADGGALGGGNDDIGHELGLLEYVCHNPVCRCSYQLVCDCERWRASGTHTEDRALEPTIIPTWPSARSSRSPPTSAVAAGTMRSVVDTIWRSEEHTSELQSLLRISYAVFCLQTKKLINQHHTRNTYTIN